MKILVIGGYGTFGKRLVKNIVKYNHYTIIIAGRSSEKASAFQQEIKQDFNQQIETICLDLNGSNLEKIFNQIKPFIVVNAAGPYNLEPGLKNDHNHFKVAKACLLSHCHYIDLADNREYVNRFSGSLNEYAKEQQLSFITGASTVPALTDAVLEHYSSQFLKVTSINYGISPGNKTERGQATIASILSYTGKAFQIVKNNQNKTVFGWQGLTQHDFGKPLGNRWMSNCDIPDLDLIPQKYPHIKNIQFKAGLELPFLHIALWGLSWLVRLKIVNNLNRYTKLLTKISEWFLGFGTDSGGMFIELKGVGFDQKEKILNWQLVAEKGVGPNVPIISAELIIKKTIDGKTKSGAMPCMGMFTLEEFFEIAKRWNIRQVEISNDEPLVVQEIGKVR